mgnify:CR=1 FL=1
MDVHIRRLREKIETTPSNPKYVHTNGESAIISTDKINFDEGIRREGKK